MKKFLVIRRDNIGDLICTTPLIHALRKHFPEARIDALVNSYNRPVLERNPDLTEVHHYTKLKHRPPGCSAFSVVLERLRLYARLRRIRYDYAIIAGANFLPRGVKLARALRPRHIIGFTDPDHPLSRHIDMGIPYELPRPLHEVEDVFRLLRPLGVDDTPGPMQLYPDQALAREIAARSGLPHDSSVLGIHISARKPSNRWPETQFARLIQALHHRNPTQHYALFWSPGDENNPMHPGDDQKLQRLMGQLDGIPVHPVRTERLEELIAGMSLCDRFVLSDGGALHIVAALGKPTVSLFGKSDASRWHPWGVPHVVLQPETLEVADVSVEEVLSALEQLPGPRSSQSEHQSSA